VTVQIEPGDSSTKQPEMGRKLASGRVIWSTVTTHLERRTPRVASDRHRDSHLQRNHGSGRSSVPSAQREERGSRARVRWERAYLGSEGGSHGRWIACRGRGLLGFRSAEATGRKERDEDDECGSLVKCRRDSRKTGNFVLWSLFTGSVSTEASPSFFSSIPQLFYLSIFW
jgi:hypothetical protein